MVGLIITVHFQQFENLKFLIFSPEGACPRTPDQFEEQLSQANEQRNIFLLNYHNICHEISKPLNLDIQVNSGLQPWWMTQEIQIKIT